MATEIITKVQLQDYIGKKTDKQSELVRLAINGFIEQYCHRDFSEDESDREEAVRITSGDQRTLIVRKPPIISLTSIVVGESGNTSPVDSTSYDVDLRGGKILMLFGNFLSNSRYVVAYKGGFTEIPEDIRLAALSIAAREISHASKGRFGMRGRAYQGNSVELFIDGLTKTERVILDSYELMRLD